MYTINQLKEFLGLLKKMLHVYCALPVFVCLLISLVMCVASILSNQWWVGQFKAEVPLSNYSKVGYYLHIEFSVTYTFVEECWKMTIVDAHKFYITNYAVVKKCEGEHPYTPLDKQILEGKMDPFMHTFICLIVSLVFNVMALTFAFLKSPFVCKTKQPGLRISTATASLFSATASIVGLVIFNKNIYYGAPFMQAMKVDPPVIARDLPDSISKLVSKVFSKVRAADLSEKFSKGLSFTLLCAGAVFLVLVLILCLIEFCLARNARQDDYNEPMLTEAKSIKNKDDFLNTQSV